MCFALLGAFLARQHGSKVPPKPPVYVAALTSIPTNQINWTTVALSCLAFYSLDRVAPHPLRKMIASSERNEPNTCFGVRLLAARSFTHATHAAHPTNIVVCRLFVRFFLFFPFFFFQRDRREPGRARAEGHAGELHRSSHHSAAAGWTIPSVPGFDANRRIYCWARDGNGGVGGDGRRGSDSGSGSGVRGRSGRARRPGGPGRGGEHRVPPSISHPSRLLPGRPALRGESKTWQEKKQGRTTPACLPLLLLFVEAVLAVVFVSLSLSAQRAVSLLVRSIGPCVRIAFACTGGSQPACTSSASFVVTHLLCCDGGLSVWPSLVCHPLLSPVPPIALDLLAYTTYTPTFRTATTRYLRSPPSCRVCVSRVSRPRRGTNEPGGPACGGSL